MGYRLDVAEIVSGTVKKIAGVREKKGVSGRPQFFAGERLFAFVAQERVALKLPAEVKYAKEAALFRQAARFVMSTAPPQARGRSRTTG